MALNRYPYQAGHLLILPRGHIGRIQDLPEACRKEMDGWMVKAMNALEDGMGSQGINIGLNQGKAAGAGIAEHLHWHLVPRWEGDHNFMPVLGETFVLPEDPMHTFDCLIQWFLPEEEDS
ncbi:HIT domain-containing protein [Thiohalorhabdus sp. Cl-TMA]|uniref:HIT domain-containing protein n=1 Tax=Thiohalorhabdus methylotrophus TaxID=3242694 RepID=A0ABV4TYE7_9GAMM